MRRVHRSHSATPARVVLPTVGKAGSRWHDSVQRFPLLLECGMQTCMVESSCTPNNRSCISVEREKGHPFCVAQLEEGGIRQPVLLVNLVQFLLWKNKTCKTAYAPNSRSCSPAQLEEGYRSVRAVEEFCSSQWREIGGGP